MASFGRILAKFPRQTVFETSLRQQRQLKNKILKRTIVYTESGAVLEEPSRVKLGFLKVAVTVLSFLYVGASISKSGAAFLEENDIFVPDDDDD